MKIFKQIFIIFFLLPTLVLANDPIEEMKKVRTDYYDKYEPATKARMTTVVQEYYLKMFYDFANVGQTMFINVQDKYQAFNALYNEWQRIRIDQTMSLEEKALYYASMKATFQSIQAQTSSMLNRSSELRAISGEMCEHDNVYSISERYHPDLLFPIQKLTFEPGEGPKIDMSYYFEIGMTYGSDGSIGYDPTSGVGTASGAINDPDLSEDQQAATGMVAAVITGVICAASIGLGCNPAGYAIAFAISAFVLNNIFKLVNKNAAELEYAEKMNELSDIYDDINTHVADVHSRLNGPYVQSFESTCKKVFIDREPNETKMDDYLASFVTAISKANKEIKNGVALFMADYDKFKQDYASWLDDEIRVLTLLEGRLDKMYQQSMTNYFANQLKIDQEARDYFLNKAMPSIMKLRTEQDKQSRAWVNQADHLFGQYIEGEIKFDSSDKFHALPWRSFKKVIYQNLGGTP